jgi:hypothetical protein
MVAAVGTTCLWIRICDRVGPFDRWLRALLASLRFLAEYAIGRDGVLVELKVLYDFTSLIVTDRDIAPGPSSVYDAIRIRDLSFGFPDTAAPRCGPARNDDFISNGNRLQVSDVELDRDAEASMEKAWRPAHRFVQQCGYDTTVSNAMVAHLLNPGSEPCKHPFPVHPKAHVEAGSIAVATNETGLGIRKFLQSNSRQALGTQAQIYLENGVEQYHGVGRIVG